MEEWRSSSSKRNPVLCCCNSGQVTILLTGETPEELQRLFSETELNARGEKVFAAWTEEFRQFIWGITIHYRWSVIFFRRTTWIWIYLSCPNPQPEFHPVLPLTAQLIREQRNYNSNALRQIVDWDSAKLNSDQRVAHEDIYRAVDTAGDSFFFLDELREIRKTVFINFIFAKVQSEEKIVLAVASSGIAATLLDNGTTAYFRFKILV
jgi:PIF1-like helicase